MLPLILVLCITTVIFKLLFNQVTKPTNFPPGPFWLPFIGNELQISKLKSQFGNLHLTFSHLSKIYNTKVLGLKLTNEYFIIVSDYSLIRQIHLNDAFNARPDSFFFKLRRFGYPNGGITGADGDIWLQNRMFAIRHLKSLGFGKQQMTTMVKDEVAEMLEVLEKDGQNFEVGKFIAPGILNILWKLISGHRISREKLYYLLDLFKARGACFDVTGGLLSRMSWIRFIAPKWSGYKLITNINAKIEHFIQETIELHYKTWEEHRDDDLIYSYISEMKTRKDSIFTDKNLVILCYDFFIAGTQITSATIEILFLMMLQYPNIQKKVHEEIDQFIDKDQVLDYSDSLKLPYINAVLIESQRLYNVVPLNGPRRALYDTDLDGYFIPKGSTILMSYYDTHHNEDQWKGSTEFRPERFLDSNNKFQHPEKFLTFGLGKRFCIGEVLAKHCIFFFFVEILRKYKIQFSSETTQMDKFVGSGITLYGKYKADFIKRN